MRCELPDFQLKSAQEQAALGDEGVRRLLDAGRAWELAPVLRAGGTVIFPHTGIAACGHQVASAVHACLVIGAQVTGAQHLHLPDTEAVQKSDAFAVGREFPARGFVLDGLDGQLRKTDAVTEERDADTPGLP